MVETPSDRIKPHPSRAEIRGYINSVVRVALVLIVCLFIIVGVSTGWIRLLAGIAALSLVGWIFRKDFRPLLYLMMTITQRNRFDEASTTAQATIKNRRIIEHRSSSETTYTYEMIIEFDACEQDGQTKPVLLRALVMKDLYESKTSPVMVRYSQEDQRIAVLEGEKNFETGV